MMTIRLPIIVLVWWYTMMMMMQLSSFIRPVHSLASASASASSTQKRPIQAVYAGPPERYPEYQKTLQQAFQKSQLDVSLTKINDLTTTQQQHTINPSFVDYIIYSPNGPLQDFTPFTNLKAVLSLRAGVDGIVDNPTLPTSIPVARLVDPGLREGMVEYVVGHTLRYHLSIDKLWQQTHAGIWMSTRIIPSLARQRTVGILGLGELGGSCAEALTRLHFQVYGWSRTEKQQQKRSDHDHDNTIHCCHGPEGLDIVLAQSDILVLLLPDTPETHHIIHRETLSKCKPGVKLINVGRGSAIQEDDLLEALHSGMVGGATLDVFQQEPLPRDHGFWNHPNVLITPHIAAKTRATTASTVIAENIQRAERGEPLLYVVDREAGY